MPENSSITAPNNPVEPVAAPQNGTLGNQAKPEKVRVSVALTTPPETEVQVSGTVADAGNGWLAITDNTDQIYAWGPSFSGEALVTGKIQKRDDGQYLLVERIKRIRKRSPLVWVFAILVIALVPAILYYGVTLSIPDFHVADIIGPKEPPVHMSDLQKDKLTAYRIELIWHEGPVLCSELRNVGKIVIPKDDLDRISFTVNNVTATWNRTTLPEKLMLGKRITLCLCAETGAGCPSDATTFRYDKVGDSYPNVAIEIRPWFGATTASKRIQA